MNRLTLILRSLRHFWGSSVAVLLGLAIANAVLTGALMVGDSVRGSLRELAMQRLGDTRHMLFSPTPLDEDLITRLSEKADLKEASGALFMRGGIADSRGDRRTAQVQIAAAPGLVELKPREVLLNDQVAEAVGEEGSVVLSVPALQITPGNALIAKRERSEAVSGLRATIAGVSDQNSVARLFSLSPSQRVPKNAWTNLRDLQNAVGVRNKVNVVLVNDDIAEATLNEHLTTVMELRDYGLFLQAGGAKEGEEPAEVVLGSDTTYVVPSVEAAAQKAAQDHDIALRRVLVYFASKIERVVENQPEHTIHYAIIAGLDRSPDVELGPNDVAIDEFTANQMGAKVGDEIRLSYYLRGDDGLLRETSAELAFTLKQVLPMQGLAIDATLTPEYEGLTDADSVADWDPPGGLPIDQSKVVDKDEDYWDAHRAAPRLFLNLQTAQKLFGQEYGQLTSIRIPADKREVFEQALLKHLTPGSVGLTFVNIREQQLQASEGATDFSLLFIGFSFYLIISAVVLGSMLMRLNAERRRRQLGLLAGVGFSPGGITRIMLGEGLLLASVGTLIGAGLAILYTWLIVLALTTWWVDAVGTTALSLHVYAATVIIGSVISFALAMAALWWSVRRIGANKPAELLRGQTEDSVKRGGWGSFVLGIVADAGGAALIVLGLLGVLPLEPACLGGGALLLVGMLAWLHFNMRPALRRKAAGANNMLELAFRNAGRHRARSVLTAALVALAAFSIVVVASMKMTDVDSGEPRSGTGGFNLILTADIPLPANLSEREGRDLMGITELDDPAFAETTFISMPMYAGQDASCLNLTRPDRPTILSVSDELIERNAFTFASQSRHDVDNPWSLLRGRLDPPTKDGARRIPVVTDSETAQYILKLGIGDSLSFHDQTGRRVELVLVGTLSASIFQSELLMHEANFRELFPFQGGFNTVLIDAKPEAAQRLRDMLPAELDEYAVSVDTTRARLLAYKQVANTYLSTFQLLGSLGLMLGTLGLAVSLMRGMLERRRELALLGALGFTPSWRSGLVFSENLVLLVMGLFAGAFSALIGVLPAMGSGREINLKAVASSMGLVLVVGTIALALALALSRRATPADLRAE